MTEIQGTVSGNFICALRQVYFFTAFKAIANSRKQILVKGQLTIGILSIDLIGFVNNGAVID